MFNDNVWEPALVLVIRCAKLFWLYKCNCKSDSKSVQSCATSFLGWTH